MLLAKLCIFVGFAGATSSLRAETLGNFTFIDNWTSITITGYSISAVGPVEIPATINGRPVTSLRDWAFYDCSGITSVTIPSSVTSIGSHAFDGCSGLTSISVDVANPTFSSTGGVLFNKLKTTLILSPAGITGSFAIPASVTAINSYAFQYCIGLTSVTIPPGVKSLGYAAFQGCTGLTSVAIPSGVTLVDSLAFYGCTSLASVTISSSVTSVGASSFEGCIGLNSISVEDANAIFSSVDGVLFNKVKTLLLVYPANRMGAYAIPPSVTSIGDRSFSGCSGLTGVTIPSGVTSIGNYAFQGCIGLTSAAIPSSVTFIGSSAFSGCSSITSMTIPSSVTRIGASAFYGCASIESISVDAANPNFSSTDGVLFDKLQTTLVNYPASKPGSFSIPSSVTKIADRAFVGCSGITSLRIPFSVTTIDYGTYGGSGYGAFLGCGGLTSISVDAANPNFSSTDGVLFNKLKTGLIRYPAQRIGPFSIPSSVTIIALGAFHGCTGLTSVTIPASVKGYGSTVFQGCSSLSSIEFMGNAPELLFADFFDGVPSAMTVKYHTGATGFTSPTWRGYAVVNLGAAPNRAIGTFDLQFGPVPVNSTATATMTIGNTGDSPLSVCDITYPPGFTGNWSGGTIAPGGAQEVVVTFMPILVTDYSGTVTVYSDSTAGTGKSPANGQGVAPPSPYDAWQEDKFLPPDITTGLTVMTADFDGDGLTNLLEYAFGSDPKASGAPPVALDGEGSGLQISFPCDASCKDITYTVQSSSSLSPDSWTDIARSAGGAALVPVGSLSTVSDSGAGLRTVTVTDSSGLPANGQRFLRVKVTLP